MDVLGNKRVAPNSWDFETHAEGPAEKIEFSAKMLINEPSGNIFAQSQNVGMGWDPKVMGYSIHDLEYHGRDEVR